MTLTSGILNKIIYRNDTFVVLGVKPLWGNVKVNSKYGTFTVNGNADNAEILKENAFYTFDLTESISKKYGQGYAINSITNELPPKKGDQIDFLKSVIRRYGNDNDWVVFQNTFDKIPMEPYKVFSEMDLSTSVKTVLSQFTPPDQYKKWVEPYHLTSSQITDFSNACKDVYAEIDKLEANMAKTLHQSNIKASTLIAIAKGRMALNEPTINRDDPYLFDISVHDMILKAMENGDTRIPMDTIQQLVMSYRGMQSNSTYQSLLAKRVTESKFVIDGNDMMVHDVYVKELQTYKFTQNMIAHHDYYSDDFMTYLNDHHIKFTDEQLAFSKLIFTYPLVALTGGAGTGKSFVLGILVQFLQATGSAINCVAPTAQASKVLAKYTKHEATTIHSFLSTADPDDACDYLIIDESSMIDSQLCADIIDFIDKSECTAVFCGDISQLPPVGYGAPYRDILDTIQSKITLTHIFRQKNLDLIHVLSDARKGEFNVLPTSDWVNYGSCVKSKGYLEIEEVIPTIVAAIKQTGLENIGIISPLNRVVNELNIDLQSLLNPQTNVVHSGTTLFGQGDPVILKKNKQYATATNLNSAQPVYSIDDKGNQIVIDYILPTYEDPQSVRAYNGDHGIVTNIINNHLFVVTLNDSYDKQGQNVQLLFDTNSAHEMLTASQVTLGYALTVHKSQGSQFQTVFFISPQTIPQMTSKPMVYTALSRAQENIVIFTQSSFSNIPVYRDTYVSGKLPQS